MLGMQDLNSDEMTKKLEDILPVTQQVNTQFRDPVCKLNNITTSITL